MGAQRSDEVDVEFFEQYIDCTSEAASTHPSRYTGSLQFNMGERRNINISKEFVLAEVSRPDETDSNIEVRSMAPMFMYSEEAPPRWRWCDENNVCNDLRLRILKSELERMGFTCTVANRYRHGTQRLILKVEVNIAWSLN